MNDYKILFLCVYLIPVHDTSAKWLKNHFFYMKDAECAETNKKSILRFLVFLRYDRFCTQMSNFR